MTELDQTLGAFNRQLCNNCVIRCGTIKGRGNNLTLDDGAHIGHFFRTLINQNNHEVNLGVIQFDRLGNLLNNHGLAGLRRRNNQTTLPLTNGRNQVDHARSEGLCRGLHSQLLVGVNRRELGELAARLRILNAHTVDRVNANQCVVLLALALAFTGRTNRTCDSITGTQSPATNIAEGDINVIRSGQVAGGTNECVVFLNVQDARNRCKILFGDRRRLATLATLDAFIALTAFTTSLTSASTATSFAITTGTIAGLGIITIGKGNLNVLRRRGSTFLFFVTSRGRQIQGNGLRFCSFTRDNATTTALSRKVSVVR